MKTTGRYTQNQTEAITTFKTALCVSAAAGSGKTTVLVERFLYAVTEKGVAPGRVLAITFTDKAANEMKTRLVRESTVRGLPGLRRELENAYIGTIHSFCSRILQENPIESGVDPAFKVLSQAEAEVLSSRVLDELFESQADRPAALDFLAEAGESAVRSSILSLYEAFRAAACDEALLRTAEPSGPAESARKEARALIQTLTAQLPRQELSDTELKIKDAAAEIILLLDNKRMNAADVVQLLEKKKQFHRRGRFKDQAEAIQSSVEKVISYELMRIFRPAKEEFLKFFTQFKETYEQEKRKIAAYDFEDLLLFVYELLSGDSPEKKAVRERYRNHFEAILVDEYQDTSPLQAKIIELLRRPDNLFAVGDAQQSIYGFRNAEPEVFRRLQSETRTLALTDNYRSREAVLGFVNHLFEKAFSSETFQPLVSRRAFKHDKPHAVEWLCIVRGKKDSMSTEKARVLEARTLARRIRELVDSRYVVEAPEGPRAIRYSDIALLMATTTNIHLYEKELSEAGIPAYSLKNKGFFEKPEVKDALNLLMMVEGRNADIATAGVLRSPFVGLSDDALLWLAQFVKNESRESSLLSGVERWNQITALNAEDRGRLERFHALFGELRASRDRVRLYDLLEKAYRATDYEAKILSRPDGYQQLANVRKLLQIAQGAEANGITGTHEFVRYVQKLSEREITEPEAKIHGEEGDVVTLSTIHAAKGLEFACVVLADMGNEGSREGLGLVAASAEAGLGMKWYFSDTGDLSSEDRKLLRDYAYCHQEEVIASKEDAERDRLLYVALTRAKELLILSGTMEDASSDSDKDNGSSWTARIAREIAFTSAFADTETLEYAGNSIRILKPAKEVIGTPSTPKLVPAENGALKNALMSGSLRPADTAAWKGGWEKEAWSDLSRRLEPVERGYEEIRDATVTELVSVTRESESVVVEPEPIRELPDEDLLLPRNEFGTIFHRVLELMVYRKGAALEDAAMEQLLRPLAASQVEELKEGVRNFWNGPLGRQIKQSRKIYPELPFIYKTKKGILKGQIDLLFQTAKGEWVLVDYKTNQVDNATIGMVSDFYKMQLSLYAYIIGRLSGHYPKNGSLYFSSMNEIVTFPYDDSSFEDFEKIIETLFTDLSS